MSVPGNTLTYADPSVIGGATYTYAVRAVDTAGNPSAGSNSIAVTTPTAAVTGTTCPAAAANAFTGCYYNNLTLSGSPTVVRTDAQINFDWGGSAPVPGLTPSQFSVRWQGNFTFSAGTNTFTALMSDGMRVYLDGSVILDRWYEQAGTMVTFDQTLTAGTHLVTVEYFDHGDWSMAHLSWLSSAPVMQAPAVLSFTATPASIVPGQASALTWSVKGATSVSIDSGVGDVTTLTSRSVAPMQTTAYTLTATNSAGSATARATVTVASAQDTQPPTAPVLNSAIAASTAQVNLSWSPSTDNVGVAGYQVARSGSVIGTTTATTYTDTGAAPGTSYTYAVRAFDAAGNYSGASNGMSVTTPGGSTSTGSCPGPASNAFTGCYYNNLTMSGEPSLARTDPQINFDWQAGSPAPSVTPYAFSARWQGSLNFDQGDYVFTTIASDGMRIYIDGNLVMDRWRNQAATMYTFPQTLNQGTHLITVEYFVLVGWPTAHVTWQKQ